MNRESLSPQPIPIKEQMMALQTKGTIPEIDQLGLLGEFAHQYAREDVHAAITYSGGGARFPAGLGVKRALIEAGKIGQDKRISVATSAGAIHSAVWNLIGTLDVHQWDQAVAEISHWNGLYEGWGKITKPGKSMTSVRTFSLYDFYTTNLSHIPQPKEPIAHHGTFITATKFGRQREPYLYHDACWTDDRGEIDPRLLLAAVECSAAIPFAFRPGSAPEMPLMYDGGVNKYGLTTPNAVSRILLSQSGGQSIVIEHKSNKDPGVYVEEVSVPGGVINEVTVALHKPSSVVENWRNLFLFTSEWYEKGYELGRHMIPYLS